MSTLTATADPTTGTIRIDVEQTQQRDLFTRVVANAWGNATTGGLWTNTGGAAGDYSVNGTQGLHSVNTVNVLRSSTINLGGPDHASMSQVTLAVLPITSPFRVRQFMRYTDASNHYFAQLEIRTDNTVALKLRKTVLGVTTDITSEVILTATNAAGATWNIASRVCGNNVYAKAWRSTVTEPAWILSSSTPELPTGSSAGMGSLLVTGNTNPLPVVFTYDNFVGWIGEDLHLYRVTPDGVRTEVRGSPFDTEPPTAAAATGVATFYDNESPLDTDVFYELKSDCSTLVYATSNTVSLLSDGDGWLRDPTDPNLNVRISVSSDIFDFCDETARVEFGGLGDPTYSNASGIFDIIDYAKPRTVSMTRKRYASELVLVSKVLEDVDLLEAIFANGRILLLSLPPVYGFGRPHGSDYITCADITQAFIGIDQTVSARVWSIPFRLSDEPADTSEGGTGGNGLGVPGATYDDLAASALGVTYANLAASGLTYLQIAQGTGY